MELERIRRLVGPVTREQLRLVDCFVGDSVALFIPAAGQCGYAVMPAHTHPGYSFIVNFDDPFIAANGYEPLAVYRIGTPVATVWTYAQNLDPKQVVPL